MLARLYERLKGNPVVVLVVAGLVVAVGIDLVDLADGVTRILQIAEMLGISVVARARVTPYTPTNPLVRYGD